MCRGIGDLHAAKEFLAVRTYDLYVEIHTAPQNANVV
jgi:hypothetical protein